ncbi:MAG: FAD-dependent thymidylate synthase [Anaerolineae bacterium]|nr:FAD-dependent thymidylate synthase [Anaerolineae bacterium]MDW8299795.1 FAD-dependent thymidylate synthase [Anaerolineae bacterium]
MVDLLALLNSPVPVLDRGWIELIDAMPHPSSGVSADNVVVSSARVSRLGESKGAEADRKLIHYLMRHKHLSPFEHVVFTFRLKAPLVVWWQWVRHRTASYNLMSGRYVELPEDEYYIPETWRLQALHNRQASAGELPSDAAERLTAELSAHIARGHALYKQALALGVAREQARLFLSGFSVYYIGYITQNLRNAFHFLRLRMAEDAQYEIRAYATAMYQSFVKPFAPICCEAWESLGQGGDE